MSHYFGREGVNHYTVHRIPVMESPLLRSSITLLNEYEYQTPTINHKNNTQHATDGHCNITHSMHLCTYMYTQMCMHVHVHVHIHVHVCTQL